MEGIDGNIRAKEYLPQNMKWFYFASYIAGMFCLFFWTAVIASVIVTGRFKTMGIRSLLLLAPLAFFVWAAEEMRRAYRGIKIDD
jgi:hypothetical protein